MFYTRFRTYKPRLRGIQGNVLSIVLLLVGISLVCVVNGQRDTTLRFQPDGSFTIVVFTDLHYGEGEDLDSKNDALQRTILDAEQPDLVVYLGDFVSGWMGGSKRGWMERMMRRILAYPNEQGYKHAMLLGNHDDEADLTRTEILEMDTRISGDLSHTQVGPIQLTGSSNYHVDVLSATPGEESRVDARLWFFDSMNRGCENDSLSWGCVGTDTVAWMKDITSGGMMSPALQSLAFVHIPLPEHRFGYGDFRATGIRQEDSACPVVNTGLAEQLVYSNVSMVVSGHDHQNDFVGNIYLEGQERTNDTATRFLPGSGYSRYGDIPMLMAYGRKSGYGSYGPGDITRGARVIRLQTIQTSVDLALSEIKETRLQYPTVYSYNQYWALPPQQMHTGPFSQMQTWVANEFGSREIERRPNFKYEVQPQCYSGACSVHHVASLIVAMSLLYTIIIIFIQ
jgi:pre-mRNA-splicing factor SYF1